MSQQRKYLSAALGLALVLWAFQVARAERLPLKAYTTADGLAHNSINKIVRDSRGFLWFCTDEGLSLFDGYEFTNYGINDGLPHAVVTDIIETKEGDYWVATLGGLARFSPKAVRGSANLESGMFVVLTPADDRDRNARALTTLLQGHDGTIWCGTRKRLYRLSQAGSKFELQPVVVKLPAGSREISEVTALQEDQYGTLWIGTANGLYRRWADGNAARYGKENGLPDDHIHDLLVDRRGELWIGTRYGGLARISIGADDARLAITRIYNLKNGFLSDWIFDLYESSDGRVWVGTNLGLVEFSADDKRESPSHVYIKSAGFIYHEISNIAEDSDGNLWLGTVNGAMKLARNGFLTFGEADGIVAVNSIFESDNGELNFYGYVLGDERASVFEGGKVDLLKPGSVHYRFSLGHFNGQKFSWFLPNAWKSNGYSDKPFIIQSRTGEWWFGADSGLYQLPRVRTFSHLKTARPVAVYTTKDGLTTPIVYSIYEDSRGDIWISTFSPTGSGLARWERATRKVRDLSQTEGLPSLKEKTPASFAEDRAGNVWIGFNQGELARFAAGRLTPFTTDDGVPPGRINNLHVDRAGRLWIATSRGGVGRLDDPNVPRPNFVSYSTANGLSSDLTTALTEDMDGRIYVGTGHGVDQITPETGQIKHFTTADGLAPGEILTAIRDRSGALWFGTRQGLSRFIPGPERASAPPAILINGLSAAGEHQNISALGETDVTLPELAAGDNQLVIDFVGLSFTSGEVLRYQYRLDGVGRNWSPLTEQRTVNFANLAPGRYKFLVRAVTSDGVASAVPASIAFTVLPHVYQRWWFLLLIALSIILISYTFYRNRVARLVELERVRTRIASDLHDEIGSNLSLIAMVSDVATGKFREADLQVAAWLKLIANTSRETVDSMSDIVWVVNPNKDRVVDLIRRMRRVADDTFTANEIAFHFNTSGVDENIKIGAETRREVFLIFKEAVNNIACHSHCTRAEVKLLINRNSLTLRLSDNGQGFRVSANGDGNGLLSMKRRATNLSGSLEITSAPSQGTTVFLKAPINGRS